MNVMRIGRVERREKKERENGDVKDEDDKVFLRTLTRYLRSRSGTKKQKRGKIWRLIA